MIKHHKHFDVDRQTMIKRDLALYEFNLTKIEKQERRKQQNKKSAKATRHRRIKLQQFAQNVLNDLQTHLNSNQENDSNHNSEIISQLNKFKHILRLLDDKKNGKKHKLELTYTTNIKKKNKKHKSLQLETNKNYSILKYLNLTPTKRKVE